MPVLNEFKQFLLRGSVVDLAVGVVVGAAFTTVVNALVSDILTPLISAIIKVPDFSTWSFVLRGSVFKYGHFLNAFIAFLLSATAVFFFIIKPMNLLRNFRKKEEKATTKKCTECLSDIPLSAKRCAHCTQLVAE